MLNNKLIRPLRWYYLYVLILIGWMIYANLTGWRIFSTSAKQPWTAQGAGYHK